MTGHHKILAALLMIFLLTCGLLSGCGGDACGGTETGNPTCSAVTEDGEGTSDSGEDGDDGEIQAESLSATEELLYWLCSAVKSCYSTFDYSSCTDAAASDENLLSAFGADTGVYADFDELQDAIDSNTVEVDGTVFSDCIDAIDALSCSEIQVANAFTENSSDYSHLSGIVPESCAEVF